MKRAQEVALATTSQLGGVVDTSMQDSTTQQLASAVPAPPTPRGSLGPRKIVLSPCLKSPSLRSLAETLLLIFHHKVYLLKVFFFFQSYGRERTENVRIAVKQITVFVEADRIAGCFPRTPL